MKAWLRYEGYTRADGLIDVHASTNDNRDRGYASEAATWTLGPLTRAGFEAVCRQSRVGVSGIVVTVTLDGERV